MLLRNKKNNAVIALVIAAILVGIDQLIKWLIVNNPKYDVSIPWIRIGDTELIDITRIYNDGAAFGILAGKQSFLIPVTSGFIICAIVFLLLEKSKSKWMTAAITLIIAGGIGNLVDRVRLGYVVDFIKLKFISFAIFNFADMCAVVGAILLFLVVFIEEIKANKENKANKEKDVSNNDANANADTNADDDSNSSCSKQITESQENE